MPNNSAPVAKSRQQLLEELVVCLLETETTGRTITAPLSKTNEVRVTFAAQPTQAEMKRMIEIMQIIAAGCPEQEPARKKAHDVIVALR